MNYSISSLVNKKCLHTVEDKNNLAGRCLFTLNKRRHEQVGFEFPSLKNKKQDHCPECRVHCAIFLKSQDNDRQRLPVECTNASRAGICEQLAVK